MKKINGKIACGILAASMFAASFTGCGKLDGTQIAATVGEEKVTLGLASYMMRDQQAQTESYYMMLAQSYGMNMPASIWEEEGNEGKTFGENVKDGVMENIHDLYVLRAHAKDYDVTISEEEQKKIEEAAKAFMAANTEDVLEELAVSESDIITYLELMTYQQKMRESMVADVDKKVSEDEANQTQVTIVKVSTKGTEKDDDGKIIDLTDEEKAAKKELAEKVHEKVATSEKVAEADMNSMAKEIDESLMASEVHFTTAGNEEEILDEKVKEAVKELKDGELAAEVVEGADGYYVVRLDLKFDKEATESKKSTIISNREKEMYDSLMDDWTEETKLKVEDSVWKKLKVTDSKSFQYKPEEKEEEPKDDTENETEDSAEE